MVIEIPRPCSVHGERDWLYCGECWEEMLSAEEFRNWLGE